MQLVATQLNGKNFHNWSRSIRHALGAKNKLDFINGELPEPSINSPNCKVWMKVDYTVSSWILNCISKELVQAFDYIDNSQKLWNELNNRFGRSNGLMIYRLRREIAGFVQGNSTVLVYFNELQSLWDELSLLLPTVVCTCGASQAAKDLEKNERLMQFLMGLNEVYKAIQSQILILDPLPSLIRVYAMVLQAEDKKSDCYFSRQHRAEYYVYFD